MRVFSKVKKPGIKVPAPKKASMSGFAHVTPPRQKPLKTRIYTKEAARQDPSDFYGFGFGKTGLESYD